MYINFLKHFRFCRSFHFFPYHTTISLQMSISIFHFVREYLCGLRDCHVANLFLSGVQSNRCESFMSLPFKVQSKNVKYSEECIESRYVYPSTRVNKTDSGYVVKNVEEVIHFRTERKIPKTGFLMVGLGGNNGTTVYGGVLANKHDITWQTKDGLRKPDFFGSLLQSSTMQLGFEGDFGVGKEFWITMKDMVPMINPADLVIGGWDINSAPLDECARRNKVLDLDLQKNLKKYWEKVVPMKGVYYEDFIAPNQKPRANHILDSKLTKQEHLELIRKDIRDFKKNNSLDKIIVVWSANTERFVEVTPGLHDTEDNVLKAIKNNEKEISQSIIYCVASILEGCSYVNGSPQNTFVPGIVELSKTHSVFIAGDDFKTGQTKIKSSLVDFLVSSGLKPESIHLGNNDGLNLKSEKQFKSKEISKKGVVRDMVESNSVLFPTAKNPDHVIVIKYVPYVGDSKRAMDEYTSSIFLGGKNTIVLHNTCEDSLLAAPLIIDLVVMTELFERITVRRDGEKEWKKFNPILSGLSFFLKAPFVPQGTPVVNALFRQRCCIENLLRALVGLPANANMLLEQKIDH